MARKSLALMAKLNSFIKDKIPEILLISGIFLLSLSLTHNFLRSRSLRLDQETVSSYVAREPAADQSMLPVHIFIPWNTDTDITQQAYVAGEWTVSPDKVSYLSSSALPGGSGNTILYGHNKRNILGNIRVLKGGETITLTLKSGAIRKYIVERVTTVTPTQTSLLLPTETETLTLYTCAGFMDSQRFVVRAKPIAQPTYQQSISDVVF
jgi:LPXTG-site transpeptidase (sortase) family protein